MLFSYLRNSNINLLLKFVKSVELSFQKRSLLLGVVGAPTSAGQSKPGVELGPKAIRLAGLIEQIQYLGHNVIDFGDFNDNYVKDIDLNEIYINDKQNDRKLLNTSLVQQMTVRLSSLVAKVVKDNRIPIILGGDHSTAIASISGNASAQTIGQLCVVWVDAHADINTVQSTTTGHFHGMPVSFLIKQIPQMFGNPNENCLPVKPCIDAKNFAFIGLRDVESSEMDIIRKLNITYFSTQDIDKLGIHEVMARLLDTINPKLEKKIHISFDIDAVDQSLAPSTGTAVPGGLTLREALTIGEQISATNMLCGLDLVEVNPAIGDQNDVRNTVECALNIILSFLGVKESMDNSKVYKKLEERKRIDEINFKRAAIGPIKKTYKTDPTKIENRN